MAKDDELDAVPDEPQEAAIEEEHDDSHDDSEAAIEEEHDDSSDTDHEDSGEDDVSSDDEEGPSKEEVVLSIQEGLSLFRYYSTQGVLTPAQQEEIIAHLMKAMYYNVPNDSMIECCIYSSSVIASLYFASEQARTGKNTLSITLHKYPGSKLIKFYEALHSTDPDIKSAITSQILEEANTSGWTDLLAVAMTYNSQGKYDDAIVLYKDILKLIANSEEDILAMPDIYLRMSQTLESRGKLDDVHPRVDLVDIHHDGADAAPALVGASPNIKGVEFEV